MSRIKSLLLDKAEAERVLNSMQAEQATYCPNFNQWVIELENDPEYLEKVEKRLDAELGADRLF